MGHTVLLIQQKIGFQIVVQYSTLNRVRTLTKESQNVFEFSKSMTEDRIPDLKSIFYKKGAKI